VAGQSKGTGAREEEFDQFLPASITSDSCPLTNHTHTHFHTCTELEMHTPTHKHKHANSSAYHSKVEVFDSA